MITVYLDGEFLKLSLEELEKSGYNVIVNKTNGYSHDWQEVVEFDSKLIRNVGGVETIWCTKKPIGFVDGSSQVSFS
jgi:hypothetical protein